MAHGTDRPSEGSPVTQQIQRRGVRRGVRWLSIVVALVAWPVVVGTTLYVHELYHTHSLAWAAWAAIHTGYIGVLTAVAVVLFLRAFDGFAERTDAELKRLLETEQETSRRLNELAQARREIVTQVAHEIRTPLTILDGSTDSLARHHEQLPAAERRGLIEAIQGAAQRLESLPDLLQRVMQPDDPEQLRRFSR